MGQCTSSREEESRRCGPRRSTIQEVSLFDDLGEPVVLQTENVGPKGIFVKSDLLYDPGEELWVSFNVPNGPKIVVRGQVVRGDFGGEGKPAGMGIIFTDLTPRERKWLEEYSSEEAEGESAWQVFATSTTKSLEASF